MNTKGLKNTNRNSHIIETYKQYFITERIENPKVSVIIPCYNVENFVTECIGSLVKQTFKDFELICINDGSIDSTLDILNEFAKFDSRIKIINQENSGQSCARNRGLELAKGEYISFIDSDDWVDENFIELLYKTIVKYDCDIACTSIERKRKTSEKYRVNYTEEILCSSLSDKIKVCEIPKCCYIWNKLYKKNLVINSFFQTGACYEDVLWLPEIIKQSKNLVTVPNTKYYYRVNNNSTVKSIQSPKKQKDLYNAKKYIVKFFEENNLDLADKEKHITKEIKYLFGIPILNTKEYKNTDTTLLFDFIPIKRKKVLQQLKLKVLKKFFLIKNMDSHYYIELFRKIRISIKNSTRFKYEKTIKYGINKDVRTPKLIVSLASYPQRINTVNITIETLLNQSIKPDKLILWLAESQFPNKEKDLPESLVHLKEFGLEIEWCEDLKSYKKLVPALKKYPEDIIVTADDDLYYQHDWLETLYNEYLKNPNYIYTRRASGISLKNNLISIVQHYANNNFKPTYLNQLMGGAGTLYPPHSLHGDVFDTEQIKSLIPTHDDIYFWVMAILKGTKICLIKTNDANLYTIEGTQDCGLCKQTRNKNVGMLPEIAFRRILDKYPQVQDTLEKESLNA